MMVDAAGWCGPAFRELRWPRRFFEPLASLISVTIAEVPRGYPHAMMTPAPIITS